MKVDIPAYQVGVAFLLAAVLMYATAAGGFSPRLFAYGKPLAIACAVLGLAIAAIHYAPEAMERARSVWAGKPKAEPEPAVAAKPKASHAAKPVPASHPKAIVIPPDDSPQIERVIVEPAPAADPAQANPYDSKLKHAAKSVGRFLHVGPKHDP